jgi:hypothetical protein
MQCTRSARVHAARDSCACASPAAMAACSCACVSSPRDASRAAIRASSARVFALAPGATCQTVRARSRSDPRSASREVFSHSRSSAAKSSALGPFARRVIALANWRMLANARWSGARPRSCSYCSASASVVLVICARREENWAIAFSGNPAITRPLEAGRYAHSKPNRRVSPVSSANAASADPAPFARYKPRESIDRHRPSRTVWTLFSHST